MLLAGLMRSRIGRKMLCDGKLAEHSTANVMTHDCTPLKSVLHTAEIGAQMLVGMSLAFALLLFKQDTILNEDAVYS